MFPNYHGWFKVVPDAGGGHLLFSRGKHIGERAADVAAVHIEYIEWMDRIALEDAAEATVIQLLDTRIDTVCPICAWPLNFCRCEECLEV